MLRYRNPVQKNGTAEKLAEMYALCYWRMMMIHPFNTRWSKAVFKTPVADYLVVSMDFSTDVFFVATCKVLISFLEVIYGQ